MESEHLKIITESLDTVLKHVPVGVAILEGPEFRYFSINKKLADLNGLPIREHLGKPLVEVLPNAEQKLLPEIRKIMETGNPIQREFSISLPKNPNVPIHLIDFLYPILGKEGKPRAILAIVFDISSRKQTEAALKESEDRYRILIETMQDGIGMQDKNGIVTYVNPSLGKMLGFTAKEMIGQKASKFYDIENRAILKTATRKRGFNKSYEIEWQGKNGIKIPTVMSPRGIFDQDGKYQGSFAVVGDITERKKAESWLKESEQKYRQLFESAIDMIHIVDDQYNIIDINNTELRKLGYSRKELIGQPLNKILHPDFRPTTKGRIQTVRDGETIKSYETALLTKDGKKILVKVNVVPKMVGGKFIGAQAIIHDITESKKAESQLKESYKALREMGYKLESIREEEKKRIAVEIHDQLGQELTAIKLELYLINVLFKQKKDLSKMDQVLMAKVNSVISKTSSTIETVRRISHDLRPAVLDHLGLISSIRMLLKNFEQSNNIKVKANILDDELDFEQDFTVNVYRVLQEALTNISKHANATLVKIDFIIKDELMELNISDNGAGFNQDKIKESEKFGIYNMTERIKKLEGDFRIRSKENSGTSIKITFPAYKFNS